LTNELALAAFLLMGVQALQQGMIT